MELRLPAPCLVVMVGPSGAGKTTWANTWFQETEIVSSDRLRGMVGAGAEDQQAGTAAFALLEQIVTERTRRKLTTVVDTLGLDRDNRRRWVELAHSAGMPAFAVAFATPAADVRRRNAARDHPLPRRALDRQLSGMATALPELDEDGFDRVISEQPVAVVAPAIAESEATARTSPRPGGHSLGLVVSRFDWGLERDQLPDAIAAIAARAEAAGFRDLWVMDHFRQLPRTGREWEDLPEAYTTLSYLAGVTSAIRLGALVTAVGHRHPVVLGKMLATLDVLSGGRANLGLGIGWHREEHEGYGIPFPPTAVRYQVLEDTLRMLPLLWGKGSPPFEGSTFSAKELMCYPRPVQEHIPILIGGSGEQKTLRLVAKYADACNLFGRPEVVARKVEILHRHCAEFERDPGEVEVTHLLDMMTAPDRKALRERVDLLRGRNMPADAYMTRHNAGTAEDQLDHIAAYRAAGADHSIVTIPDVHLEGSIEAFAPVIEKLARS